MKLRLTAMLLAVPALVAGLLVIAPAEAAPAHSSYVLTRSVAVKSYNSELSVAKISLACRSSSPCSGRLYFGGANMASQPKAAYTIAGKTTRTMTVYLRKNTDQDPATGTPDPGGLYSYRANAQLWVDESGPKNVVPFYYGIRTETPVAKGQIKFNILGDLSGLSNLRLDMVRVLLGGNTKEYPQPIVANSGVISMALGTNNADSAPFILKLSATVNGEDRSFYWHGVDGNTDGGVLSIGEASAVRATKGVFDANFYIGKMQGATTSGAHVKALGVPSTYSGAQFRASLDSPSCANEFGADVASGGSYSIPFLPYDGQGSQKARYMVTAKSGSYEAWRGDSAAKYGSCSDVLKYSYSGDNLITIPTTVNLTPGPSNTNVKVRRYYSGFTPTNSDANVRLREMIPGLTVLQAPIVFEGTATQGDGRDITFNDVPPGKYWVEVGRRTGCSNWYPSVYSNNSAYFNGEDRGAEAWKSFRTLGSLSSSMRARAIDHGATSAQNTKPSGYAGWMYREYCKAYGTGTYSDSIDIQADQGLVQESANTNRKGAIVKGRVTRAGGRTNKEMLVRLSSTDGKRVLRTDVTDSGGYFYIAGLPSGNWTISVNSDSWRGIGRTFSGKHSIKVTAGKTYSAGTLYFQG